MEKYKKDLKKRINLISIGMIVIACIIIYDQFFAMESLKNDHIYEFQIGMIVGLAFVGCIYVVRMKRLLDDEKKLRIAFNDENDERRRAIRQKAGLPVLLYTSILMLVAGIVAGYYSEIIFMTLVIAALCQLFIAFILKQIYSKIL
ncbi:MAG: hypothetical protein PUC65_04620 [Clostridiales bacterium]|nr:hypothetical protein [Clostridiales bacterium]